MRRKLFLVTAFLSALMFAGCNSNDPNDSNKAISESHYETGMYVGITSFSDNVKYYGSVYDRRYHSLTKSNSASFTSFINGLSMGDATVLYYAVDENLSYLEGCQFPADLSSVNIITFTDGLNQGSRALDKQNGNHDYAADDKSYVAEINKKIKSIKVGGLPINAYAIGIRGKDVQGDAAKTFSDNLVHLSSNKDNAMEVANMDEVSAKFKEIAESLYKKSESRTLRITIPMPSENEKERFTFDDVTDATASKCYLEGVYAGGALTDIKYVGCMSTSGNKVQETSAGGVKIQFEFENFTDDKGSTISFSKMQQWHMETSQTTWTRNSEFKPSEAIVTTEERKTAVVMLILDCSSSLGSDFAKVKSAASDFIKTLAGEINSSGNNPDGGDNLNDGDNPQSETTYYIKHPWGTGQDADWTWKKMTKEGNNYVFSGPWGGIGANINTVASDDGALWFPEDEINGAYSLNISDGVKFTYNPSNSTLSATQISSGSGSVAQVRFRKEQAYERVLAMSIDQKVGGEWNTPAEYYFGTGSGTTSYYEIPAGSLYPFYYYQGDTDDDTGWYFVFDDPYTYSFVAGKRYTFNCGDDGSYIEFSIILDGSANAPAKVVAQKRILKSEMRKYNKK